MITNNTLYLDELTNLEIVEIINSFAPEKLKQKYYRYCQTVRVKDKVEVQFVDDYYNYIAIILNDHEILRDYIVADKTGERKLARNKAYHNAVKQMLAKKRIDVKAYAEDYCEYWQGKEDALKKSIEPECKLIEALIDNAEQEYDIENT